MLDPVLRDDLDHHVKAHEAELIEFRRALHRHPELGREEHRTTAALVARLVEAGLQPRVLSCGTGVICDVIGAPRRAPDGGLSRRHRRASAQRRQGRARTARSVDGVCHACGHDAHTAVVLGAALVLAELAEAGQLDDRSA